MPHTVTKQPSTMLKYVYMKNRHIDIMEKQKMYVIKSFIK
jgi:hypothetical protein